MSFSASEITVNNLVRQFNTKKKKKKKEFQVEANKNLKKFRDR